MTCTQCARQTTKWLPLVGSRREMDSTFCQTLFYRLQRTSSGGLNCRWTFSASGYAFRSSRPKKGNRRPAIKRKVCRHSRHDTLFLAIFLAMPISLLWIPGPSSPSNVKPPYDDVRWLTYSGTSVSEIIQLVIWRETCLE